MSNQTDTPCIPCVSPTPGRVTTLPDGTRLTSWDARGRMRTAIAVALLGMSPSTALLAQTRQVVLPEGTEVHAMTIARITSTSSVVGDQTRLRVTHPVVVDSAVVIPRGAIMRAVVSEVKQRGLMGRPGRINIRVESTVAVDGQRLALRASSGGAAPEGLPPVFTAIVFGPVWLLSRGDDAVIDEGMMVTAYTDEPATISVPLTQDASMFEPEVPLTGTWIAVVDGTIFTLYIVEQGRTISGSGDIDPPDKSMRHITITGKSTATDVTLALVSGSTTHHWTLQRVSATELRGDLSSAGALNVIISLQRQ